MDERSNSEAAPGAAVPPHSSIRRWIVPSLAGLGWKGRLRWILLRLVGYYIFIVLGIAIFQRRLIYHPASAEALPAQRAGLTPGAIHDLEVTTGDGLQLHGWHLLPHGRLADDDQQWDSALRDGESVVLYFPSNSGNRGERITECRTFTDLGAHVVLFDYRGYGENPGAPSETGIAGDARVVWRYVTAELGISPGRVIVFGESLGGAVAVRLAAEQSASDQPPAALVLCGTFSSLTETGSVRFPWMPVRWLLVDRYASTERIDAVTCPVIQFHGDQDEMVPIDLARKLFSRIPERSGSGIRKQFVELVGSGHNDFAEHRFREPLEEFLKQLPRD